MAMPSKAFCIQIFFCANWESSPVAASRIGRAKPLQPAQTGSIAILESVRDDSATAVARAFVRRIAEDNAARRDDETSCAWYENKKGPAKSPSLFDHS